MSPYRLNYTQLLLMQYFLISHFLANRSCSRQSKLKIEYKVAAYLFWMYGVHDFSMYVKSVLDTHVNKAGMWVYKGVIIQFVGKFDLMLGLSKSVEQTASTHVMDYTEAW